MCRLMHVLCELLLESGSLRFAWLALLALGPYEVRMHILFWQAFYAANLRPAALTSRSSNQILTHTYIYM